MDESQRTTFFQEIDDLRHRLGDLERRVRSSSTQPADVPKVAKPEIIKSSETPPVSPKPSSAPNSWEVFYQKPVKPESTSFGASRVLGFVAVICFVLAASFLIKLAIDSGWLTPARQLGLSGAFGVSLIFFGLFFEKKDLEYFSLLPGAGVIILHMTAYAGTLYYGLYGGWIAAALVSVVSVTSILLFRRFRQEFYALVAVLGTYLCPFLIPALRESQMDVMAFFLLWDVAFAVISIMIASRSMVLLASYLALGVFALISPIMASGVTPGELQTVAVFQLIQFTVFALGVLAYTINQRAPLKGTEAWVYFPVLLFFYGLEYFIVSRLNPDLAPWLGVGFAAVIYGLYVASRGFLQKSVLDSEPMVISAVSLILFHAFYLELLPDRFCPWFALGLISLWPWLSQRLDLKGRFGLVGFVILLVFGLNYGRLLFWVDPGIMDFELVLLNSLFFFTLFAAYSFNLRNKKGSDRDGLMVVLVLAHTQAMFALYRFSDQLSTWLGSPTLERFLVSILWGLFALSILLWSQSKKDQRVAYSSLFVFSIAVGKVLLFDVANSGSVVRILCLLTLGGVLYLGGYLYRKIERWA